MNPESEAANQAVSQVIRIVGDGLDIALRLTGAAAKGNGHSAVHCHEKSGRKKTNQAVRS